VTLLTVHDVVERTQLSEKTVYRALERGELVGAKFGGVWRIRPEAVEAWYESKLGGPAEPRRRRRAEPAARGLRRLAAIEGGRR
jgi:excisionase family DNA binding protein